MELYVQPMLARLIPLLNRPETPRTLLENSAIAIARLGYVCPTLVAPHLQEFIQPWCQSLRSIRDNSEKESAYLGLCKMVQLNPNALVNHLVYFCDAITQWNRVSPELNRIFAEV